MITRREVRREVKRVPNKFGARGNTIQVELKLIETRVTMFREQVKIYLNVNEFEKMHDVTGKLINEIKRYEKLIDRING